MSGVSHELKTPLTLIRLYTETLLDEEQFRPEERRGFYQIILRESERLTHLIERALDFGRVERREKQYQIEEGDLAYRPPRLWPRAPVERKWPRHLVRLGPELDHRHRHGDRSGEGTGPGTDCPEGNPNWGQPILFQEPRALRVGARLTW